MRNTQPNNKWQWGKAGNGGDPDPYVHEDSSKKDVRTCTNTTLCAEGKSRKVTQPPNVTQSFGSTLSRKCNERRGNKQNEHERTASEEQTQRAAKTLPPRTASDGMVATKQISHKRDSSENAAERFVLDFYRENRHDVVGGDKYRLLHNINRDRMDDARVGDAVESRIRDLSVNNYQMPSSSSSSMSSSRQHVPVSLTSDLHAVNASSSASVLFCRNDFDYQLRKNVLSRTDPPGHHHSKTNDIECNVDVNNIENDQNRVNVVVGCSRHVTVLMSDEIDHEVGGEEMSANSNVKSFQSADKSSSAPVSGPIIKADNLIITSAIENLSMASANGTPSKAKYSNDVVTLREKRRRDRRDRRLARTRATSLSTTTNEILPDIVNGNHSPPPYADIPPQQIVPSIVSTVPVEDNRYTFSLPLVRR